jgi:hypothetical protein
MIYQHSPPPDRLGVAQPALYGMRLIPEPTLQASSISGISPTTTGAPSILNVEKRQVNSFIGWLSSGGTCGLLFIFESLLKLLSLTIRELDIPDYCASGGFFTVFGAYAGCCYSTACAHYVATCVRQYLDLGWRMVHLCLVRLTWTTSIAVLIV